MDKLKLPPCGLLLGTGIYPLSRDYLLCTLHGHQTWVAEESSPVAMLDRVLADRQGNLVQLWGHARGYSAATQAEWFYALDEIEVHVPAPNWETGEHVRWQDCEALRTHADRRGAGLWRFIREAAARGLYTVLIYADSEPAWVRRFAEAGDWYVGYDFGERFTFGFDNAAASGPRQVTLRTLADDLLARVRRHVDERHAAGWGHVLATSSNFHIDYEIAAGADLPLLEDFAFCHLNQASALSRGLYAQYDLPLWGAHLAHEHYAWLPASSGLRYELLRAALRQKYLGGAKLLINESGGWFVEASLCEDSPKFEFPRVPLAPDEVSWSGETPPRFAPYIPAAREHYAAVGYDSEWCRRYREAIAEFYDFVQTHGTPAGQPETTLAIAKGDLDLGCHRYMPNYAIAGAYDLADRDPRWFEGPPERGWDLVREVFFPLRPVLGEYPNLFLSGTPHGPVDIVSFADEQLTGAWLAEHYRVLLFAGWNTCSPRQYEVLTDYVTRGGTLFVGLAHLSTNVTRDYTSFGVDELVHGGDLSALCGLRVTGRGERIYWATGPDGSDELGFRFPRRFGILAVPLGEVEFTDPAVEVLMVDDEQARPVLVRRRLGAGCVYFLNTWAYPGALAADDGPGGRVGSAGLIGTLYRHLARQCRGTVWLSGDECDYVAYGYFPDDGRLCLQNVDLRQPRTVTLHLPDETMDVTLAPGEFVLRAVTAAG